MTDYLRPGVYSSESLLPAAVSSGNGSTSCAIVGPLNRGPAEATTVSSWREFLARYGDWAINSADPAYEANESGGPFSTLMGAYQFFANGGGELTVLRLIGASATAASTSFLSTVTAEPRADATVADPAVLSVRALNVGAWGNRVAVQLSPSRGSVTVGVTEIPNFDIVVFYSAPGSAAGLGNVVERFPGVSIVRGAPNFIESRINGLSAWISVTVPVLPVDTTPVNPVLAGVPVALHNGSNGLPLDSIQKELRNFDDVQRPLTINAPGNTNKTQLGELLLYCRERGNGFAVLDTPDLPPTSEDTGDSVLTWVESLAAKSSHGAAYYPHVSVTDPRTGQGGLVTVPPGASVLGTMARIDRVVGIWQAPAGPLGSLPGVARPARNLNEAELDALNSANYPVNALRVLNGIGTAVMGARTLDQSMADKYVSVRRTLSYLRTEMTDILNFALFQPNGPELWLEARTRLNHFLGVFWQQGGLRGNREPAAFYVKCDQENNPPHLVAAGELHVEVGVAVEYPAEFVILKLSQINGSVSVTTNA